MMLCLICVFSMGAVIRTEQENIFNQDELGDIHDIRTGEWDALKMAQVMSRQFRSFVSSAESCESWGVKSSCSTGVRPQQTERGNILLIVWASKQGNLFTESSVRQMKTVEDKILLDKNFTDFCLRWDKTGIDTSCKKPLSVLGLFYPRFGNTAQTVQHLDALDGNVDGMLDVFSTPGLDNALSALLSGQASPAQLAVQLQQYLLSGSEAEKVAAHVFNATVPFLASGNDRGTELKT